MDCRIQFGNDGFNFQAALINRRPLQLFITTLLSLKTTAQSGLKLIPSLLMASGGIKVIAVCGQGGVILLLANDAVV